MRRSFLFAIIFGFCGGVILTEFWVIPIFWLVGGMVVAAAFLVTHPAPSAKHVGAPLPRREGKVWWPRLLAIFLVTLGLGPLRTHAWLYDANGLERYVDQRLVIRGDVTDLPMLRYGRQEIVLTGLESGAMHLHGQISIRLPEYPKVYLGQQLEVNCSITAFSEKSRLRQRMHDVRTYCGSPEILATDHAVWSARLQLGRIKSWAIDRISANFPEPQSSLLIGILLGRQVPMPPDLDEAFRVTGTTHIIALSGFNVTMIITAISAVLIRVVGRRWAWLPALGFVTAFIIMTGASASVTRAGVMSSIVLVALRLGRPVSMLRLLGYTLLAMVWHNPLVLIHDLGFQLSFLATAGLVYVAPAIQHRLRLVPETFSIRENLGTTLAAISMTEPLLFWHFAWVSLVAPMVNVLILPLIPLAMAFGFLALIVPPLWPAADAILSLVIHIIQFGAALPFALQTLPAVGVGLAAMLVTWFCILNIRKTHALRLAAV